jgi:hypothetical protein
MANPTSNFNWQMPTASDLVTDLPADFEVFGQAVDTSLADLKGGTTDQVLAKNSNTDMDFKWVTSDDANAIQNSIVDAKGDLIAATANDTPARLAVGANNLYLVADSTAATGLKYEGAITSWTPTFTNLTVGNGTLNAAEYQRIGNLVFCYIQFTMGSTSAVTGDVHFTLPIGASKRGYQTGNAYYLDSGVQVLGGSIELVGGSSNGYFRATNSAGTWIAPSYTFTATQPFAWTTNDVMQAYFYYEVN